MEAVIETKQGYKKTKIGWIPVDWNYSKIHKVTDYVDYRGKTPLKTEDGIFLVTAKNIKDGYIDYECSKEYVSHEDYDRIMSRGKPAIGDVLITTEAPMGNVAQINKENIALAQRVIKYCTNNKDLDNDFLKWYFLSPAFKKELDLESSGTTVKGIKGSRLHRMPIVLPPLPEQQKIAQILSTWDKAIEQTQNLIEQLKSRKKGLMQQLLTGKTRLKGFSGDWKEYSIDELFKNTTRYVKWDEEESYTLISIRRRYGGLFFRGDLFGHSIGVKKLKSIHRGDFLISKRQVSHGAWAIVKEKFHNGKVSDEYICLEISNTKILSSDFWNFFIQQKYLTYYAFLDSIGVHIEKLIFHYKWFAKRKVHIPSSLEEQQAIAKVLNTADTEIKTQETYLAQLQAQKKGLMQQLLTGQKRVNVNN